MFYVSKHQFAFKTSKKTKNKPSTAHDNFAHAFVAARTERGSIWVSWAWCRYNLQSGMEEADLGAMFTYKILLKDFSSLGPPSKVGIFHHNLLNDVSS